MEKRPKMVQCWTYVHENEWQRLKSVAETKKRGISETLRGILYYWLDEHRIPYPQSGEENG